MDAVPRQEHGRLGRTGSHPHTATTIGSRALPAEAIEAVEASRTAGASLPPRGRWRRRRELCQGQELLAVELEQQVVLPVRLTWALAPAPASSGRSHHGGRGKGMAGCVRRPSLRRPNSPWSAAL